MARPQIASDTDILEAARRVLVRRGHDAFTLSEVAQEAGLSRAAILLRFESADALKVKLNAVMVEQFIAALDELPASPSGENLLQVAAFIGRMISSRSKLAAYLAIFSANLRGGDLAKLERKRGAAVAATISKCMPQTPIGHDAAVNGFLAQLSGSILAWQAQSDVEAYVYLVERSKEWLTLARIPFDARFTGADAPQFKPSARPVRARAGAQK